LRHFSVGLGFVMTFAIGVGVQQAASASRRMRMAWRLTGLSVALTLAAIAVSRLQFANAAPFVLRFGGLIVTLALLNLYQRVRMPENRRMIFMVDMVALYVTMAVAMMIYQYALATFHATSISQALRSADNAVGFHWIAYSAFVAKIKPLSATLEFAYSNWMREFVIGLAVITYQRKFDDMYEFTYAYIVAGMATLSVTAFLDSESLDAVAAYAIHGFHHPVGVAPETNAKLEALRAGLDRTLDFDRVIGLVSFPSFHAGSALLMAVATRNLRWFWLPFLIFNELILVGVISEGGHELVDLAAGCAFAIGGLAVAGALMRSLRAQRQPPVSLS
jgi:hypothetical protein